MRHSVRWIAVFCLCFLFLGAARKSAVTVRCYTESSASELPDFTRTVKLAYLGRTTKIGKMASISESHIDDVRTFKAKDGSMGAYFKLSDIGRFALETASSQYLGRALVIYVNNRQVIDLVIDKKIDDGVLVIPFGLTENEALLLEKNFEKKKPES